MVRTRVVLLHQPGLVKNVSKLSQINKHCGGERALHKITRKISPTTGAELEIKQLQETTYSSKYKICKGCTRLTSEVLKC